MIGLFLWLILVRWRWPCDICSILALSSCFWCHINVDTHFHSIQVHVWKGHIFFQNGISTSKCICCFIPSSVRDIQMQYKWGILLLWLCLVSNKLYFKRLVYLVCDVTARVRKKMPVNKTEVWPANVYITQTYSTWVYTISHAHWILLTAQGLWIQFRTLNYCQPLALRIDSTA